MWYGVDTPPLYDVCKKGLEFLGARRQNLSRLRVEKLGCAGSRQVIPTSNYLVWSFGGQARVYIKSSWSPRTTGMLLCSSSWAVSSPLYSPKTKTRHRRPLQPAVFNQKTRPCKESPPQDFFPFTKT
jgi:hypothetical protein